jgi:hypothetical protein
VDDVISRLRSFIDAAFEADTDECILWPFAVRQSSGYAAYSFALEGKKFNVDAHRHVCARKHGPAPPGHEASHKCGKKLCINPRHLRWATKRYNMEDAKKHGTLRGGGRYRQRFFRKEIAEIKASPESHIALGRRYEVDASYIGRLRRG